MPPMSNEPLDLNNCPMRQIVESAWAERENFDLTGIGYGQSHTHPNQTVTKPYPYYYFLAGLVQITQARRIVEIGTHQGGSTLAMAKALEKTGEGKIVTFDVTPFGAQMFKDHDFIKAYTCDANSEKAFNLVAEEFGGKRVDLVFIDAIHQFWPSLLNVLIYGETFAARFIVLDDITFNDEMKRLWELLRMRYGAENVIDASEVDKQIRLPGGSAPGFGVVRCRGINRPD